MIMTITATIRTMIPRSCASLITILASASVSICVLTLSALIIDQEVLIVVSYIMPLFILRRLIGSICHIMVSCVLR